MTSSVASALSGYSHESNKPTSSIASLNGRQISANDTKSTTGSPEKRIHLQAVAVLVALLQSTQDEESRKQIFEKAPTLARDAIMQNGLLLKYASLTLRNDKAVVLAAVKQNRLALKYASDVLKNDEELVLMALNGSP